MDDSMRGATRRAAVMVLALAVVLSACAAGANGAAGVPSEAGRLAGFWMGLWHGIITPITFVISLFSDNVNVYEIHNNGGWYNFGFVLGAVFLIGGSCGSRRRK